MPPRRNRDINDVYDRIMARIEERLDQFVDQFVDRMNDMMNPRRRGDRDGRKGEGEELEYSFFEGDEDENNVSFSGVVMGVEEESMPVYDTDIEDVIDGEEDNMEDIVVVVVLIFQKP
nr:reverse transcriptase domain-containing protein [Tanacetum cinerariifolium]